VNGTAKRWVGVSPPGVGAVVAWAVSGGLAAMAVARIAAWDALDVLVLLNTVTLYLYLPAWIVAVVALLRRRVWLAGLSLLVVAAQVAFVLPELLAATAIPTWAVHAPTFRIFDANVYDNNPSMAGYARQILTDRPDVVALEEAGGNDEAQLVSAHALAGLPYRSVVNRADPWAFVVASRYPLQRIRVVTLYGRPLMVQLVLDLPTGPVPLWVVHTVAPVPGSWQQWSGQLARIAQLLGSPPPQHLVVVGDFNATWNTRGFRRLLDSGLTDAAAARGQWLQMTWSQTLPVLPPFIRIDHILTGSDVAVVRITTGVGVGSDHRDLWATVAVRGAG
jgi:endonuclease/exonuclease/phosphatase (EEP) superfamily protein YafD